VRPRCTRPSAVQEGMSPKGSTLRPRDGDDGPAHRYGASRPLAADARRDGRREALRARDGGLSPQRVERRLLVQPNVALVPADSVEIAGRSQCDRPEPVDLEMDEGL